MKATLKVRRSSSAIVDEEVPPIWFQEWMESNTAWQQSFTAQIEKLIKALDRIEESQVRQEAKFFESVRREKEQIEEAQTTD